MSRSVIRFVSLPFFLIALGVPARHAVAVEWHVNPDGTGDAPTIQAAYDAASPGDLIVLAPGTYADSHTRVIQGFPPTESASTTAVAFIKAGVDLESSGGADVTIIDGEDVRHGLLGADVGAVGIRGVTFARGTTAGTDGGTEIWGGGVLVYRSQVTIEECRFVDCKAPAIAGGGGGGVFLNGGSGSILRGNLFLRGFSSQLGAGVELHLHSNGLIENNTFVDNSALERGGAILLNGSSAAVINNIFSENSAGETGGAIGCFSPVSITGSCNLFWENQAPEGPHVGDCGFVVGANDNLVADPLFCDAGSDNYTIQASSPAAPGHPSGCGLRGAYGIGCGVISVEAMSWGRIKGSYR